MARIEKTVFISYRRTDVYIALAVYENLKNQLYDVFFDYRSISSGDFEQIITSNIRARAHFLLILTPSALARCNEPGDWLRREIETAIDERRNIVPLFCKGFRFEAPAKSEKSKWFRFGRSATSETLTGNLKDLRRYNGLNVHEDYFEEAMYRLRTEFLSKPLDTVLHPVSSEVQKVVRAEQVAADRALERIDDVRELVKQADEKLHQPMADPDVETITKTSASTVNMSIRGEKTARGNVANRWMRSIRGPNFNFRLTGGIIGGLLLLALLIRSGVNIFQNQLSNTPAPTLNAQVVKTQIYQTLETNTPLPITTPTLASTRVSQPVMTITSSPTAIPDIGSTMIGKDGMTLLYVPASEFTMGSDNGDPSEKPVHTVYLDAFWIDKTEVTNKMYSLCVNAGNCMPPTSTTSYTRSNYYGNLQYDNYPVIYVSWEDAETYCSWADRRLPTETEWEKAARGVDGRTYPWGENIDCEMANFGACEGDTTEVGSYASGQSPYGLFDMAGNVWEWVADWYDANYYFSSPSSNPPGSSIGQYRVVRGGSFANIPTAVETTNRFKMVPADSYYVSTFQYAFPGCYDTYITSYCDSLYTRVYVTPGFRCAMDAP